MKYLGVLGQTEGIVAEQTSQTLVGKAIAAGSNTITGLTNSNLSGTAGITNANLASGIDASKITTGTLPTAQVPSLTGDVTKPSGSSTTTIADAFKNNVALNIYAALGGSIKAESIITLFNVSSTGTMTSGGVRILAVWLPKAATITGAMWYQGNLGVYTPNNYNGVGLYTYSTGTLTLVASSTNDGTIWSGGVSGAPNIKAFSSTYSATAGLYFVACLFSASSTTTAPTIGIGPGLSAAVAAMDFTNSAKLMGQVTGQTSLPTPLAMSSVAGASAATYLSLY